MLSKKSATESAFAMASQRPWTSSFSFSLAASSANRLFSSFIFLASYSACCLAAYALSSAILAAMASYLALSSAAKRFSSSC
jgi:hypothetical protein